MALRLDLGMLAGEFLAELATAGISMGHEQLVLAKCPAETRIRCFGEAEAIYS